MSWKKKERELSPEEAIAIAKRDLSPFWYGCAPLLVGVPTETGASAMPLDPSVNQGTLLLCFIDPTDFTGESAYFFLKEYSRRFAINGIKVLLIFKPRYAFMGEQRTVENMVRKYQIGIPLVVDSEGLLSTAFKVGKIPKAILLSDGKIVWEHAGLDWVDLVETEIQKILRFKDPGLALLQLFKPAVDVQVDVAKIELGRGRGATFPAPGFKQNETGEWFGEFKERRPATLKQGQIHLLGKWKQEENRLVTTDSKSELSFTCPTSCFSVVAQSVAQVSESGKIVIEMNNGQALFEAFRREDAAFDDDGNSMLKVEFPRLYNAALKLPDKFREITLRFPVAGNVAVAIYGLRFGDRKKYT